MKILQNSDTPIYRQISAQYKEDILCGRLKEGEYLPSVRSLAKELKISVITTLKAYDELVNEGLVDAVQGKGYIVKPQDAQMLREQYMRLIEQQLQGAIDNARLAGISADELADMVKLLYDAV
ncbi:MAG: GntR family transcriptional regulator [Eubacterium sp.]|nr:GntR family transcriptional regulator [Eubacterium sp.]